MKIARLIGSVLLVFIIGQRVAATTLTTIGAAYLQDFDTLAASGTSSTVPAGWAFLETGSAANTTYSASAGTSTTGNTYSFGSGAAADRAFGALQSGTLNPTIGAGFLNNTGVAITSLDISYFGEQWRLGALGRVDRLEFAFSTDATALNNGTWSSLVALNFLAPITAGTVGSLDGNAAANRALVSSSITGLSIPAGGTFWIRWSDFDATGSDDGLGVDDFSLTPRAAVNTPDRLPLLAALAPIFALLFSLRRSRDSAA